MQVGIAFAHLVLCMPACNACISTGCDCTVGLQGQGVWGEGPVRKFSQPPPACVWFEGQHRNGMRTIRHPNFFQCPVSSEEHRAEAMDLPAPLLQPDLGMRA